MENWMEKWRHFYHDFQTNNLKMLEPAAPWRTHQVAVIGHVGHCHALGQQFPCDSLVGSPVLGTVMMPCWSLEKNLRNVTCHVGLAYGCIIYIYILAAIPITCITLVHDVLLNIHWHKLAHGNTLELRQSKDLRSPISRHNRQARLIGQKKRCS